MKKRDKPIPANFKMYILEQEIEGRDFVRIEFERDMGRAASYISGPRSILNKPTDLYDLLCNAGANLVIPRSEAMSLVQYMISNREKILGLYCSTAGWKSTPHGTGYLLGRNLITISADKPPIFLSDDLKPSDTTTSGMISRWKKEVAALAVHSDAASIAIMTSLAGSLLMFSKLTETFVINFAGNAPQESQPHCVSLHLYGVTQQYCHHGTLQNKD